MYNITEGFQFCTVALLSKNLFYTERKVNKAIKLSL